MLAAPAPKATHAAGDIRVFTRRLAAERSGTWTLGTWSLAWLSTGVVGLLDGLTLGCVGLGGSVAGLAPSFATTGRGFSSEIDCAASTGGGEALEAALWPAALADF